jgi:hypothetical protein
MLSFGALVLSVSTLLGPLSPQGNVHVVDVSGGPGSDFTSIAAAVDAAAGGDVVLVRAGDYAPDPFDDVADGIDLHGKGLTVVAEPGSAVRIGRMEVSGLPAGQFALLQGLRATPAEFTRLESNQGQLWIEGCSYEPVFASILSGGVRATSCFTLVWTRSHCGVPPILVPNVGLSASGSDLFVFDSVVQVGADRSMALLLDTQSFLVLSGTDVSGDDGADGSSIFDCAGHDGGHALVVRGSSQAIVLDSVLQGGAGGAPFNGSCSPGEDGQDLLLESGSSTTLPGAAPSLSLSSPVREAELIQATFTGQPGDRVWLAYALRPGPGITSTRWDGALVLGAPRMGLFLGTIPPSGSIQVDFVAGELGPGVESAVLFCQAIFRAAGRFVTSSPSAVVVLDQSF